MILVTTLGSVQVGDFITEVDDEDLTQEQVNDRYTVEGQDWMEVRGFEGGGDTCRVLVYFSDDTEGKSPIFSWDAKVWKRS